MTTAWLILLFALVALAYAAVGFGGGSTYNALLVLGGTDYQAIPAIALSCNIIVVTGGVVQFYRAGHFSVRALMPYVSLSIPMAWLGGRLPVSETVFAGLLGLALAFTGLHMLLRSVRQPRPVRARNWRPWSVGLPAGAAIGFLSGLVGIGGGIFLAPLLYLLGRDTPRRIAALSSGFILVNSIAGLSGQLMKQGFDAPTSAWGQAWPLYLAVLAGGQVGSRLGALRLPDPWVRGLTGALVLYVAARLLLRWAEWVLV